METINNDKFSEDFVDTLKHVFSEFSMNSIPGTVDDVKISINHDNASDEYISKSVHLLLNAISKLLKSYIVFQNKFFKVTFHQDVFEFLKNYLNPDTTSKEEYEQNLNQLQHIIQKVFHHQLGLLEGYKVSVEKGTSQLLKSLNPREIENKFVREKMRIGPFQIPYFIIPFFVKNKIYAELISKYDDYKNDLDSVEKKFYRPSFKNGYDKPFDEEAI